MHAKIAFASSFNLLEREELVEGAVNDLLLSVARDYADLHGQEARRWTPSLIAVLGAVLTGRRLPSSPCGAQPARSSPIPSSRR
jgi:hypothetical protein